MLQNYFDKIYCINLDRRIDRWEHFLNQSKKINLDNFERVSAIDGNKLNPSDFGSSLNHGELGLVLTTIKIFEAEASLALFNIFCPLGNQWHPIDALIKKNPPPSLGWSFKRSILIWHGFDGLLLSQSVLK